MLAKPNMPIAAASRSCSVRWDRVRRQSPLASELRQVVAATGYTDDELTGMNAEAVATRTFRVLADDIVTDEGRARTRGGRRGNGTVLGRRNEATSGAPRRLLIAQVNAGRLLTVATPRLMVKRGALLSDEGQSRQYTSMTLLDDPHFVGFSSVRIRTLRETRDAGDIHGSRDYQPGGRMVSVRPSTVSIQAMRRRIESGSDCSVKTIWCICSGCSTVTLYEN